MGKKSRCGKKTYRSAVELTTDTWACSTKNHKKRLLSAMGLDKSWAETKTVKEMVKRGGGLVAKDLLVLNKTFLKNRGGVVTIEWNKKSRK